MQKMWRKNELLRGLYARKSVLSSTIKYQEQFPSNVNVGTDLANIPWICEFPASVKGIFDK